MKITFISYIYPFPNRGFNPGIERVIEEFAHELTNQGHEVHVITTYRNGGTEEFECDGGVCIHRIPDARHFMGKLGSAFSMDLLSINMSIRTYGNLLDESDIVHTFTPIVWKFFSTPMVAHYHHWDEPSDLMEYLYLPTSHKIWLRCYEIADRVIAVSEYSANDLVERGIDWNSIETVPNGVDTDEFYPGSSCIEFEGWDSILLYVGPLSERKGLKYLIKSMPGIVENNKNTGLVIVGGGDNSDLLELSNSLGIQDNIQFEGFVPDDELPEYYRAANIFVFPSLLEGFGMVLLEAMASGLPVIATNGSAIPEVVGDAAVLVPPKDPAAITESVNYVLKNSIRSEMKDDSLKRVESRFTWKNATKKLASVYDGVR